jgi:hypothetical protein
VDRVTPPKREVVDIQLPVQDAVDQLRNDGAREAARIGEHEHLEHLPGGVVGDTPRPHTAGEDELFHRVEGPFDRRKTIGNVEVVYVHSIRSEAVERPLDCTLHRFGRETLAIANVFSDAHLGGQHHPFAVASEGPSEDAL